LDDLWSEIWTLLNCYTLPGDEYTQWYLLDEVGSAISHSNIANFKCVPIFIQLSEHSKPLDMSVMWPINDCQVDDVITRDFLPNVPKGLYRDLRMLAFQSNNNALISNCLSTCRGIFNNNVIFFPFTKFFKLVIIDYFNFLIYL